MRIGNKSVKERLLAESSQMDLDFKIDDVQENWNRMEEILCKITDVVAPIVEYPKGHEPALYETLSIVAGPFCNIY